MVLYSYKNKQVTLCTIHVVVSNNNTRCLEDTHYMKHKTVINMCMTYININEIIQYNKESQYIYNLYT